MFIYWCTIEFEDGYLEQFDILAESLAQAEELALLRAISEEIWTFVERTVTDICVVKKEI